MNPGWVHESRLGMEGTRLGEFRLGEYELGEYGLGKWVWKGPNWVNPVNFSNRCC